MIAQNLLASLTDFRHGVFAPLRDEQDIPATAAPIAALGQYTQLCSNALRQGIVQQPRRVMSTPVVKPFRLDSVRLLVPKGMGSLRERCGEPDGVGESPKNLKILEDDTAPGQAGTHEDTPSPAQMAEGVVERPNLEHGDNSRAKESEDGKPDDGSLEAEDQSADTHRRRAQATEIDKGYEEKLERFAHNLQALRKEAKSGDPEQSTPRPLDGMLLRRFILSSDFDPPGRGTNRLGAILSIGIASVLVATIVYYFAVGKGQLLDPVPTAIEHPAGPAASAQTSRGIPLAPALASAPASAPAEPRSAPARAMAMRPGGMDPDEIQLLLKQGQEFVAVGDLANARIVLRRAAEAGDVAAAFALAQCYDPKVLTQMGARGVAPEIGEARRWYEIARQLGSAEAARHLALLPPKTQETATGQRTRMPDRHHGSKTDGKRFARGQHSDGSSLTFFPFR